MRYFDIRSSAQKIIRASVCIAPYTFHNEIIDGERWIDGTIHDPIGLPYLLKKNPDLPIIIVMNETIKHKFRHRVKAFLEGLGANPMYEAPLFKIFQKREKLIRSDFALAEKTKRVLIVHPPSNSPTRPRTACKQDLLRTYKAGKKAAFDIPKFLQLQS